MKLNRLKVMGLRDADMVSYPSPPYAGIATKKILVQVRLNEQPSITSPMNV